MQHIFQIFLLTSQGVFHIWCAYEIYLLKINSALFPPNIFIYYTVYCTTITMQYAEYYFLIHKLYTSCYLLFKRLAKRSWWWVGGGRSNAKCRHPKNWFVVGLCGRCLSVWGPEPHIYALPTHCIRVYSILIRTGKGGGEMNQREGKGGNSSQSWVENTNMTCRKVPLQVNF